MITNLTLLTGATVSATGGSTQTFAPTGQAIVGGIEVMDVASSSWVTAQRAQFKSRMPATTSTSSGTAYSKTKCSAVFVIPMVDSLGVTQFNHVRLEVQFHPEISAGDKAALLNKGAQMLIDTDLATFWANGSLA